MPNIISAIDIDCMSFLIDIEELGLYYFNPKNFNSISDLLDFSLNWEYDSKSLYCTGITYDVNYIVDNGTPFTDDLECISCSSIGMIFSNKNISLERFCTINHLKLETIKDKLFVKKIPIFMIANMPWVACIGDSCNEIMINYHNREMSIFEFLKSKGVLSQDSVDNALKLILCDGYDPDRALEYIDSSNQIRQVFNYHGRSYSINELRKLTGKNISRTIINNRRANGYTVETIFDDFKLD